MKSKLINENFKSDYISNLLRARGIIDVDKFLKASPDNIINPSNLVNIKDAAELLMKYINSDKAFLLIVDSDIDGMTSSSIMYNYIKDLNNNKNIVYLLHSGKQHGLEDHIDFIREHFDEFDLVILPDSSSNDYSYHEELKQYNLPCLVLDHHIVEVELSNNAVIVNNQISPNYENKELTGAGVVYQFCRYLDEDLGKSYAEKYIDLAALGIIGDMGSVLQIENRALIKLGLSNITNFFLETLIEHQSYSMGGKINPITLAFYIVPLINAMIRVGLEEEKERTFRAFLNGKEMVPCNKRGVKGKYDVEIAIESTRECVNAKSRQSKLRDKMVDILEARIYKLGLLENKVLFIELEEEDDFPSELNGLAAMILADKFKKPTLLGRKNGGYIKGSGRGLNNSPLEDFKNALAQTDLCEYSLGHPQAFGWGIKEERASKFVESLNEILKDVDFSEDVHEVNFLRTGQDTDLPELIEEVSKYTDVWGQNCPEPLILIKNIYISNSEINICGERRDTLRFSHNGVTYIQFHAKDLIEEIKGIDEIDFTIVGRANLNEWGNTITPQIFIDSYEITDAKYKF